MPRGLSGRPHAVAGPRHRKHRRGRQMLHLDGRGRCGARRAQAKRHAPIRPKLGRTQRSLRAPRGWRSSWLGRAARQGRRQTDRHVHRCHRLGRLLRMFRRTRERHDQQQRSSCHDPASGEVSSKSHRYRIIPITSAFVEFEQDWRHQVHRWSVARLRVILTTTGFSYGGTR